MIRIALSSLAAIACVACTSLDSADLRTNGMQPDMAVRSNDQSAGSKIDVQIHVGDSIVDFVNLGGADILTLQVDGGAATELNELNLLGVTTYSADVGTKEPGTEVKVIFARGEADDPAPSSTVTLTEQLALTAPTAGAALSRADDDIVVTWTSDASDDDVRVDVTGTCIQPTTRQVQAGATTVTIERGSIQKTEDSDPDDDSEIPDSCDATLSVVRTRTGTLDPAYGGGNIRHEFTASAGMTTNP
jgi:hypothetical protein